MFAGTVSQNLAQRKYPTAANYWVYDPRTATVELSGGGHMVRLG